MISFWNGLVDGLDAHAVTPFLSAVHLTHLAGNPRDIAEALLIAAAQVIVIACVFRPLESLWPAERWDERGLTRIDRTYTLLMLLGLNPLFAYLVLTPFANALGDTAAPPDAASGLAAWVPWFQSHPLALFLAYYAIYDFAYYWMHRVQHWIPWWWALHSMHHSQRQMSCWSNDRGSYVDGMLQSVFLASVGLFIGVQPDQFALLMFVGELVQNFSHANVRIGFGPLRRLFVDPRFHRLHHMVVDPARPNLHNCNYGQVLSIWDVLFGTALYDEPPRPTGVGDPVVDADNGRGVVAMQWGAFRRFWGALWTRAGWTPGDVAFGQDYRPVPVRHLDLHAFVQADPREASPTT